MIKKENKMLQVSVPKEIYDSIEQMAEAFSRHLGTKISKGMLITHIYVVWLTKSAEEFKKVKQEQEEEKKDA